MYFSKVSSQAFVFTDGQSIIVFIVSFWNFPVFIVLIISAALIASRVFRFVPDFREESISSGEDCTILYASEFSFISLKSFVLSCG